MAKEKDKAGAPFTSAAPRLVRVRVRAGHSIQLSRDQIAVGGDWIEADPHDLNVPAFRSAVETEDEVNNPKPTVDVEEHAPTGVSFDELRTAMQGQRRAAAETRAIAERRHAETTLSKE